MHCGVASDCPHRERLGYTGDGQNTGNAGMLLLDGREFYRKWIGDVMDCQDVNTGHVQHTAPFYGGGGGPCGWGCAVVAMPYLFWRNYGETDILRECWPNMMKWVGYIDSRMENGLVVREEKDGWCLGDWCAPEEIRIPEPLVNTYYLIKSLEQMIEIAVLVGCIEKIPELQARIERSMKALRENYYHKPGMDAQAADVFLADLGIGDAADFEAIRRRYDEAGCFDTGIFGTRVLTHWLFKNGYADTAVKLLAGRDENVSFHRMMKAGATTIWEDWDGKYSHDHPMFGGVTDALFGELLGIRAARPGYAEVNIEPQIPESLDWVRGSITVPAGEIRVDFDRNRSPKFIIDIPKIKACFNGCTELNHGRNTFE
jgi:alpha-L-rhamnosidase